MLLLKLIRATHKRFKRTLIYHDTDIIQRFSAASMSLVSTDFRGRSQSSATTLLDGAGRHSGEGRMAVRMRYKERKNNNKMN